MITTLSPATSALLVAAFNHPGAYQSVEWTSTVKPAAAHKGANLVKITTAVVRTGVDYANLAVNADTDTGALPWGEWAVFPYVITHKDAEYVRLYVALKNCGRCDGEGFVFDGVKDPAECPRCDGTGSVPRSMSTRYTVDGVEVSRDGFNEYLTPSQRKPSKPNGGTITVRAQSVTLL